MKYALILAVSLLVYLGGGSAHAADVTCRILGDTVRLTEEGDTLWFRLSEGSEVGLKINRSMSDGRTLVAAAILDGGRTSVVLTDRRHFQQTFLADGEPPVFVEGTCRPAN